MAPRTSTGRILFWLTLLSFVLTACPRPLTPSLPVTGVQPAFDASRVEGTVDFGPRTQATIADDVAPGATVSLIEVDSGNTVASTRTEPDGKFVLTFADGFRPLANELYYFEAVKGLKAGTGAPNAVGGDAVRLRTIGAFQAGGWVTLTNKIPGATVPLSRMTTALSVVVSLRHPTDRRVDPWTLMGAILPNVPQGAYPDYLNLPDPVLVPVSMVQRTYDLVQDSLDKDRDPFYWITLSTADTRHETVVLPDAPFTIAYLSPDAAASLERIDLVGSNFGEPGANRVYFQADGGTTVEGTVTGVSPDLTRITVQVPALAVNGPILLEVNGKTLTGPSFRVAIRDGHSVIDPAGNVYVANKDLGTVAIVERIPGTDKTGVRSLVSGLTAPTALTFGAGSFSDLYVACGGGTPMVWKIALSTQAKTAYHGAGAVANPSGIAFRSSTGALYLSDAGAGKLYVIASEGAAVQEVSVAGYALNQPRGLSFGPDGRLYVANSGSNNVLAITLSGAAAGVADEFVVGLSTPWGLSFDNRGNFYVSNFQGNSVYRMPVTSGAGVTPPVYGAISSFASIPTPAGLDADPSGYVYVADRLTNGIYRINSLAESRQVGFGMNTPTSTWVDADGMYVLTDTGRILHHNRDGTLYVYAEGLLTAKGLVKDSQGNFYTNQANLQAVTQIRPDGSSAQVVTQLGNSAGSGLSLKDDKLYIRQAASVDADGTSYSLQGEVLEYALTKDGSGMFRGADGPTQRLRTPIDKLIGIAKNATTGKFYTLNPRTRTFFEVTQPSSDRGVFTRLGTDPSLASPQDLWVDATGRIWVADYAGNNGAGSLRIYGSNGAFLKEITDIATPTNMSFDGQYLYVNSYTGGYLRAFDPATDAKVRDLAGFSAPRGFAFAGTTLYVNEWGPNRISKVENYATAPGAITSIFSTGDVYDIETNGAELLTTSGYNLRRIFFDGSVWKADGINYREFDRTQLGISKIDGKFYTVSDAPRLHSGNEGSHRAMGAGLYYQFGLYGYSGIHGDPSGWGALTPTTFVSYGKGDSHTTYVTETALNGSTHTSYRLLSVTLGGLVTDGASTVYLTNVNTGQVYKLAAGSLVTLASGGPGYGSGDRMYGGLSYYDGQIYQAIYTRHWIDRIDAASGARSTLKIGLVTPEL